MHAIGKVTRVVGAPSPTTRVLTAIVVLLLLPGVVARIPEAASHAIQQRLKARVPEVSPAIREGYTQGALVMNKQHTLALLHGWEEHFGPNPLRPKVHHLAV